MDGPPRAEAWLKTKIGAVGGHHPVKPPAIDLDVKPQLFAKSVVDTGCVIFNIHFVPDFVPGFDFSSGLPSNSASFDYLRSFDRPPPPSFSPRPLLKDRLLSLAVVQADTHRQFVGLTGRWPDRLD